MKKILFLSIIIAMMSLSACGTLEVSLDRTPIPGADSSQISTIVAATLAAIPSTTPIPEPTATLTPEEPPVLPRSLYFLEPDEQGVSQVYRIARDGFRWTQITSEAESISSFYVSSVDGSLLYSMLNGGIIALDSSGTERRVLVEYLTSDPVWSSNGEMVAYSEEGNLYLYTFATESITLLLAGSETEAFYPKQFSPDGKKLLVTSVSQSPDAPTERDVVKIYDFDSRKLIAISWSDGLPPCSNQDVSWITTDSFFCSLSVVGIGAILILPGLWRVNANDGSVEALLSSKTPPFQIVGAPRQDRMGNIYYFYGEDDGTLLYREEYSALSLVLSGANDLTKRTVLRPENYWVWDALWAPDESGIVIIEHTGDRISKGDLVFVPVNSADPTVTLLPDASAMQDNSLRWGP